MANHDLELTSSEPVLLELPWHTPQWRSLIEARSSGRLGHALLLAGPAGVGKRVFARRLAETLLCESAGPLADDACGQCRSCAQLKAGTHPNLKWIARLYDERAKKLKRDISVEQMRAVIESLALSSHYGGSRVVVIEPADALNISSVNALLKTVEEPPAGSHLVLVSERPMALAATLRSRCQRISFSIPPESQARDWLADRLPAEAVSPALALTSGAPLAALALQQSGGLERHQNWRKLWLEVAERRRGPVEAAGLLGMGGEKITAEFVQEWIQGFQRYLTDLLRAQAGTAKGQDLPGFDVEVSGIGGLQAELVDALRRMASNPIPQLLLESLMISWWRYSTPRNAEQTHRA